MVLFQSAEHSCFTTLWIFVVVSYCKCGGRGGRLHTPLETGHTSAPGDTDKREHTKLVLIKNVGQNTLPLICSTIARFWKLKM